MLCETRKFSSLAPLAAGIATLFVINCEAFAQSAYRLSPGDTVEIVLAPIPDQRQRAVIQTDGTIVLPSVGAVAIAGLTSAELQTSLEAILPTKIFRRRAPDGSERMVIIKRDDITVSVAEYRPVYVSGDVLTPGQQPYRPLMTARQAISTAGGYSLLRSRAMQTGADPADLRRDHDSFWTEYLKEHFHLLRIRAELDNKATFEKAPPNSSPLPASVAASISATESESLQTAQKDFNLERGFLDRAVEETSDQIKVLARLEQEAESGVQADTEELNRANKLLASGSLINTRVTESRRALLLSSSRRLDTTVQLMRARRQLDEYKRQIERVASQRRSGLLLQLRDTNVHLADLSVKIQALQEKLRPLGVVSSLPAGGGAMRTELIIVRKNNGEWQRMPVIEDFEIQPGDVIEVALRSDAISVSELSR